MQVEQSASKSNCSTASSTSRDQPTVHDLFNSAKKYDTKSKEAVDLNDAVARFICKDQLPIYTVEKEGFRYLL